MAPRAGDDAPLDSRDQLVAALEAGCKPTDEWRIGTEHEKFPFYANNHAPVPYGGERGIATWTAPAAGLYTVYLTLSDGRSLFQNEIAILIQDPESGGDADEGE